MQSSSSSLSQQQRSQVDAIAVHMASTASLAAEHMAQSFDGGSSPHTAHPDLQLAAMQTLLASVLSPVPHRPTFQPQALSMFCQVRTLPSCSSVWMLLSGSNAVLLECIHVVF